MPAARGRANGACESVPATGCYHVPPAAWSADASDEELEGQWVSRLGSPCGRWPRVLLVVVVVTTLVDIVLHAAASSRRWTSH